MPSILLKKTINNILQFFVPHKCVICKKEEAKICNSCFDLLIPSTKTIIDEIEVFSCFEYNDEISKILIALKYQGKAEICSIISEFLIKFYKAEIKEGDFLVPIPISFISQIKRKYNIPNLICLHLKSKLNLQILNILKKKKAKSQVGLKKIERLQNAQNFFEVKKFNNNIKGKTIILIDDVFTTGSTIKSAVLEIKKLNPLKIKVFTFAKKSLPQ